MPELPDEYIDWSAYMANESTEHREGEIGYFWFLDPDEITIVTVTTETTKKGK